MSSGANVLEELSTSDNVQLDNSSLRQWTGWVGAAAKAIAAYISGHICHGLHALSSTLESAASNHP